MDDVSFDATPEDRELIGKVVERARDLGYSQDRLLDLEMDLTACHCNGNPLDLQRLLDFPRFDFGHDIYGIGNHLDRDTGKLTGFFVPRCSKRDTASTAALKSFLGEIFASGGDTNDGEAM